jgi:hypothetical protein
MCAALAAGRRAARSAAFAETLCARVEVFHFHFAFDVVSLTTEHWQVYYVPVTSAERLFGAER